MTFLELDTLANGQATQDTGHGSVDTGQATLDTSTVAAGGKAVALTLEEAAQALGIAPRTLRRRIRAGQVAAVKVDGAHGPEWRVPVAALAEVVENVSNWSQTLPAHVHATQANGHATLDTSTVAELQRAHAEIAFLRGALDQALAALRAEQQRRHPWEPTSPPSAEPQACSRRRWWAPWRR